MKGWNIKPQSWQEITEKPPALLDDVIDWSEIQNRPTMEELRPDHQWNQTSLQFETAAGLWGNLVNLKGDQGLQGIQGVQGIQGIQGPAGPEDIEQGSWTPILRTDTDSTEPTYSYRQGFFYRIKKYIYISAVVGLQAKINTSGMITIDNLPFISSGVIPHFPSITIGTYGGNSAISQPFAPMVVFSSSRIEIRLHQLGNLRERGLGWSDLANDSYFWIGGSYIAI